MVDETREAHDPAPFDDFAALARDGYAGGGYAYVVREEPKELPETMPEEADERHPRVLLGLGRGDDGRGPVGGERERDETYGQAAVPEVREERGVECEIVDCRRARHGGTVREDTGDEIHALWVYFVARETGGSIDVLETELDGAAWFRDPPEPLKESLADRPWSWTEWE